LVEDFRPGSVVAGYRLVAPVAPGGMAMVWEARDERLGRSVALKILAPSLAADPAFRERFIAEAPLAAKVDHPHIITVLNAGEDDGVLFIAMRFVLGGDLRKVMQREGALMPERALQFIFPVALALDAAHAAGLVHRDVKPANILVDATPGQPEHVYLSDFGIAKAEQSAGLTGVGRWLGTAAYSAPEQFGGLAVDGRADQYALACLTYQLLTGAVPFPRDNLEAVMIAHRFERPPRLTALRPDLPRAADEVLAKAMAKKPDRRYKSCGAFASELLEALGVLLYGPRGPATVPAVPQRTETAAVPEMEPLTMSAEADQLYQALGAPARPAATSRMRSRRRRQVLKALEVGVTAAAVTAGIAAIIVVLMRNDGTTATPARSSGNSITEGAFTGYSGQHGPVTVESITQADGTWMAAGSASGHPAIWRRGANGSWTLASASSPKVSALTGALTSITHGPQGWIAVGNLTAPGGAPQVHAVTSSNGMSWQVNGATFPGKDPSVSGVAVGSGGYVAVGTQASSHSSANRVAAMWQSTDLRGWTLGNNDYGKNKYLDGRLHASYADAVAANPTGTFLAVGESYDNAYVCAVWTAVTNSGQQWIYGTISLPRDASSAALSWVTVNGSGFGVAAGEAVLQKGDAPIVVAVNGSGKLVPIVLQAPGGQGTVTGLTTTATGFIVTGEVGQKTAQRAVTWTLPDSSDPASSWARVSPVPVPSGVHNVTAVYAAGKTTTLAAQQDGTEIALDLPGNLGPAG
jgi:Protein kinase domain